MTPSDKEGISQVSKVVGSRFAYPMNRTYKRTGTMWEGRHKASVIDTQAYLLTCYRYVELNPVAAHMVATPEEYQWSSYGANAWGDENPLVTPHEIYLNLSRCATERLECYRSLFEEKISDEDLQTIRRATHYCQPMGDDTFKKQIEDKVGKKLGHSRRGRPRKVID